MRAPAGLLSSTEEFTPNCMAVTWSSWQSWNISGCYGPPGMLSSTSRNIHAHRRMQAVGRVLGEHRQTYWLLTETRTGPANMSSELRPTPVSVLTGAGRLVQRAPLELRPKCDRVDFKHKICSTPGRMWNSATFGRSTNSAGDRWICDVGINALWSARGFHCSIKYLLPTKLVALVEGFWCSLIGCQPFVNFVANNIYRNF